MNREFLRGFLMTIVAGILFSAILNLLVDPENLYGTGLLIPLTSQVNQMKQDLLMNRSLPPPRIVIMGSSRAMRVEPAYVTGKTGVKAVNVATEGARTTDYLAMLNFMLDHAAVRPDAIILGTEPGAFSDPPYSGWTLATHLINDQQTRMSFQSVYYALFGYPTPAGLIDESGFPRASSRDLLEQRRQAASKKTLRDSTLQTLSICGARPRLSEAAISAFEHFLDRSEQESIRLYVYATPVHPQLLRALMDSEACSRNYGEFVDTLERLQQRYRFRYLDATDVVRLGGNPDDFLDALHTGEFIQRIILDRLLDPIH